MDNTEKLRELLHASATNERNALANRQYMTNGEKIKEIFPDINIYEHGSTYSINNEYNFNASWWNAEYKESTTKNDLGVDAVSRQEVLYLVGDYDLSMGQVVKGIHALPSVTPQPRKGKWIPTYGNVKCSVCGSVKDSREVGKATHYCDFCGAKMESDLEKRKPCINYEDGCEEWAGCPCVYYKAESEET